MMNFVIGVIVGVVISTVGVSGVASFVDKQLDTAKVAIKENVK